MTSSFIALPLSSGEAFLLRTPDEAGRLWTILVDSGKKFGEGSRELAKVLSDVNPTISHIDVAICTHSDADHSQGFWHFTDDWYDLGRTIGEYWLPGRWATAMPSILTDPTVFAVKLWHGAQEAMSHVKFVDALMQPNRSPREDWLSKQLSPMLAGPLADQLATAFELLDGPANQTPYGSEFGLSPDEARALRADFDETDDTVDIFEQAMRSMKNRRVIRAEPFADPSVLEGESSVAFAEVAETATAIRKIAVAAISRGIRIRWFDFGKYEELGKALGGVRGLLEPVCAVEVRPVPKATEKISPVALFASLRLSRQNVESLVFYRPETESSPGVLMLGDSRLAHGIERPERDFPIPFSPPERELLVTAPHHGSDNNDHAFGVIGKWLGKGAAFFVRNGGQSNQKLDGYLEQKERRCAQCVQCHGKEWRQWVTVSASGPRWNWPPNANSCGTPKI